MRRWPCLALLGVAAAMAVGLPRESLDLSGPWQTVRADGLTIVPAAGWRTVAIPGAIHGYRYEASWFRRTIDVPALAEIAVRPLHRIEPHDVGVRVGQHHRPEEGEIRERRDQRDQRQRLHPVPAEGAEIGVGGH